MNEPPEEVVEAAWVVERWFNENLPSDDGEVPHWALGGVCSRRYKDDVERLESWLQSSEDEAKRRLGDIRELRNQVWQLQRMLVSGSVELDVMRQHIESARRIIATVGGEQSAAWLGQIDAVLRGEGAHLERRVERVEEGRDGGVRRESE